MGYNTRQKMLRKLDRAKKKCNHVLSHLDWCLEQFEEEEGYEKEKQYLTLMCTMIVTMREKIDEFRQNL